MKSVFLPPARADLDELRRYIISKFGNKTWSETKERIRKSVKQVEEFPLKGNIPSELADFSLLGYYQVMSGMNRIIYQIQDDTIYIHLIIDTRRDLKDVLSKRNLTR